MEELGDCCGSHVHRALLTEPLEPEHQPGAPLSLGLHFDFRLTAPYTYESRISKAVSPYRAAALPKLQSNHGAGAGRYATVQDSAQLGQET